MSRCQTHRRLSILLPQMALVTVAGTLSACASERPTFGTPQVRDAGDSGNEGADQTATFDTSAGPPASTSGNLRDSGEGKDGANSEVLTSSDDMPSQPSKDISDSDISDSDISDSDISAQGEESLSPSVDADSELVASDDGGSACRADSFATDIGECHAWTECEPGMYVASPGTATSNQECRTCEFGTYSNVANAAECTPWGNCGWFKTSDPGTHTSDVQCLAADTLDQFGSPAWDMVYAIAANRMSGRVAVAGLAGGALYSGAEGRAFVRVYDAQGGVEWTRQFGKEHNDKLAGVSLGLTGDVFIAGHFHEEIPVGNASGTRDAFVARMASSDGEEVWRRQFGTDEDEEVVAIATDGDGTSVVVGNTLGDLWETNRGGFDVFVRQYGSTGEVHWTRQFGTDMHDYAEAVAVGSRGDVAIAGSTGGDLSGETAGNADGYLRVYTSDGTSHRTVQFGTESFDAARAVSFTPSGDIAVAGYTSGVNAFLRLYRPDEDGELKMVWVRTFVSSAVTYLAASAGASGIIVATTQPDVGAFVRQYDDQGALLADRQVGSLGTDISSVALVGSDEQVFVAGYTTSSEDNDALVGIITLPPRTPQ